VTPNWVDTILPNSKNLKCGDFVPDDEMLVADDPKINTGTGYLGQQRSMSFWFNADTIPENTGNTIWSQGGSVNSISIYTYSSSGTTYLYCSAVEGSNYDFVYTPISAGVTYHAVVTYDFAGSNISLYLNGALFNTDTSMAVGSYLDSHGANIALGGQDSNTDNHLGQAITTNFDGKIADFCYWSDGSVLSASDVYDIYSTGALEKPYILWSDTSSPWSWDFDFPNGTGYYEFFSIGAWNGNYESMKTSKEAMCYYKKP
jgi:hypothetical protein